MHTALIYHHASNEADQAITGQRSALIDGHRKSREELGDCVDGRLGYEYSLGRVTQGNLAPASPDLTEGN